jgi:hypothetical protein
VRARERRPSAPPYPLPRALHALPCGDDMQTRSLAHRWGVEDEETCRELFDSLKLVHLSRTAEEMDVAMRIFSAQALRLGANSDTVAKFDRVRALPKLRSECVRRRCVRCQALRQC